MNATIAVLMHDGFYSCGTGAGLCNRALLQALVPQLRPGTRMLLLPVGLAEDAAGYDPTWHRQSLAVVAGTDADILPVDNASHGRSRFGNLDNLAAASRHAGQILSSRPSATARPPLILAVDVPFFDLARYLPTGGATNLITIAQGAGRVHAPDDSRRIAWEQAALQLSARAGGRIAATSTAMRRCLTSGYGLPQSAVVDLPNGLMPSDWQPPDVEAPPLPNASGNGFMLAMGRAEQHKGFDDLIDAAALLREQGAAVPHLLLIAATDDPQPNPYQQHLADRLAALGLDATLWTQFSHGHRQLLRHPLLRAVIVPSRVEPFGRIPLEAYAAGAAPVVSTTAGGLADLVLDGTTGFTCPPHDPVAMSAALRRALTLPGPAVSRMRGTARTFVRRRFDYERTVNDLVKTVAPWLLADPRPR